jgi:heme oxygenase
MQYRQRGSSSRTRGKLSKCHHDHVTELAAEAEALGAFYVLEGSTFGGKKILKTLRSRDGSLRDDKELEIAVVNSLGREIHREFVHRQ